VILKAYPDYKKKTLFPAILLFIILFVASCSSTKYIEDYQSIVKKVEIDSVPDKFKEEVLNYVQKDIRPAPKLGINVRLYNLFYGLFKTKSIGNPAPVLDSTLVDISRVQIEKFLQSKGYFNAKVKSAITVEKQRASILFSATPGPAFYVNQLTFDVKDSVLKDIYLKTKPSYTHVREGMQYDDDSLAYERDKIYEVAKQHGYFDFARPYIKYSVDSNLNASKTNIVLTVDNPEDKLFHPRYLIGETNIIIAPNSDGFPDSIPLNPRIFRQIRYTDLAKRFRRNPIVRYDFIKAGELYNSTMEDITYNRLYELNVFKNVKIDYQKAKDSSLVVEPIIRLIPQKKMSNRVEGEIPFNAGTVGFTLSNTYTNNNLFRGAERFEFQVKGGLQSRLGRGGSLFSDVYQRDFSVSANLAVPRLMLPFNIPMMGKNGMPFTTFSTSYVYALQKDFFVRRVFLNSVTYDWFETRSKLHSFTPLNFEYRFGGLLLVTDGPDEAQNEINRELIRNNEYNIKLLGRQDITLGIKYTYTLNQNKLLSPGSFFYFRGNMDMAGNLLDGISRLTGGHNKVSEGDFATVLGLPYNQYIRPEIDLRWYKTLGVDKQFVARLNAGVGFAYGNSETMPFEKLFFAGGSSGVRAWQARTLGPGNYNRGERLATEETRRTLYGLDQLGQMHIETNFEYRYKLLNNFFGAKLKGAVFLDAGNVWNVSSGNPQPETYFDFKKVLNQIGIGTGLGLRYDVEYFVFRFDIGLKLKDPQFEGSNQWVIGKYINGADQFKRDYKVTHSPDEYRFLQYNFGIGLPF
jgi:outer membrane protein insertion porin family